MTQKQPNLANDAKIKNSSRVFTLAEIGEVKLSNIINMALSFSGMIRLFQEGAKGMLFKPTLSTVEQVFKAESKEEFDRIHSEFCECCKKNIRLAKSNQQASYGQVAKTLNVVLKVAIYYCHLPEYERSKLLLQWLDAAVDNKMMRLLKQHFPRALPQWPPSIHDVERVHYFKIRDTVRKFIEKKQQDGTLPAYFLPVHFDDCYFRKPSYITKV